jgi:hypothetical protein
MIDGIVKRFAENKKERENAEKCRDSYEQCHVVFYFPGLRHCR